MIDLNIERPEVCLVDDESDILASFVENLKTEFKVRSFTSANEALESFKQGFKPKVVVTDLCMPGLDGLEFVSELQKQNVSAKIIMMSGHSEKSHVIQAMNSGVDLFLEKPFTMKQLKQSLRATALASAPTVTSASTDHFFEDLIGLFEALNQVYYERLARAENDLIERVPDLYSTAAEKKCFLNSLREEQALNSQISALKKSALGSRRQQ